MTVSQIHRDLYSTLEYFVPLCNKSEGENARICFCVQGKLYHFGCWSETHKFCPQLYTVPTFWSALKWRTNDLHHVYKIFIKKNSV